MQFFPDYSKFSEIYNSKEPQLVYTRYSADIHTPVSVALKLQDQKFYALFESVEGGVNRARYSFIILNPDILWKFDRGDASICEDSDSNTFTPDGKDPFISLRKLIRRSQMTIPDGLPPMSFGVFGYMGYDMVKYMERLPDKNKDSIGVPDAFFMRPREIIIFDSVKDEIIIVTPVFPDKTNDKTAYQKACMRIEAIIDLIEKRNLSHQEKSNKNTSATTVKPESSTSRETYNIMVEKAKSYIQAGDIFQVVLSQRFHCRLEHSALSLYRSLRHINPSPFLFYMKIDGFALVGSSPEILVRVRDGKVTIRPIAGTRPRGKDANEDAALEKELLKDPKELAEHLMLLDLGRNDVGRVAEVGSVKVTEKMAIEYYSHVMHIVSNVEGTLRKDKDAIDALIAGFPAGTVSGAPKIRAMEIIDELENERRSFYAGCVGYFSSNGEMDTCITFAPSSPR